MKEARNIVLFIVAIAAGFFYICNIIPQIKTEPAEVETRIGESPEALVAAGKKIFSSDRAQCLTCHSLGEDPKARCPNLEGVGSRAGSRKPGFNAAEYLIESVYSPNSYIVPGYPKNQMTPVNKPPIALSHDQILAVTAFLNSLGGKTDSAFVEQLRRAQAPWRKGLLKPQEAGSEFKLPIFPGDSRRGSTNFLGLGCASCHRLGKIGQEVGPDLTAIGASQSPEYILESILQPSAVIVRGYKMMTLVWKESSKPALLGIVRKWKPDEEHPRTVLINAEDEDGLRVNREVDLSRVASLGDTTVETKGGEGKKRYCGNYVEGDQAHGVKLLLLEDGRWREQFIPSGSIQSIHLPQSPMPGNFQDILTPRQVYDLVAYLSEQKESQ